MSKDILDNNLKSSKSRMLLENQNWTSLYVHAGSLEGKNPILLKQSKQRNKTILKHIL